MAVEAGKGTPAWLLGRVIRLSGQEFILTIRECRRGDAEISAGIFGGDIDATGGGVCGGVDGMVADECEGQAFGAGKGFHASGTGPSGGAAGAASCESDCAHGRKLDGGDETV